MAASNVCTDCSSTDLVMGAGASGNAKDTSTLDAAITMAAIADFNFLPTVFVVGKGAHICRSVVTNLFRILVGIKAEQEEIDARDSKSDIAVENIIFEKIRICLKQQEPR